jgi:hypothetical protein
MKPIKIGSAFLTLANSKFYIFLAKVMSPIIHENWLHPVLIPIAPIPIFFIKTSIKQT